MKSDGPVSTRSDAGRIEQQVVEIVQKLVIELHGPRTRATAALDDSLDRDLGLGSLERVELLLRLEEAFGVRLPDAAMAEAGTVRDLAGAIRLAAPSAPETLPEPSAPPGPAVGAPASARTLVDVLRWHAERNPERVHIILREDDGRERPIRYGTLWAQATAVATGLRDHGLRPRDTVALILRTEPAFFDAFLGVLLAGGIPVPLYPPVRLDRIEEYALRQAAILRNAAARLLLTFPEAERLAGLLRSRTPSLREVTTVERLAVPGADAPPIRLVPDDPALIQYTSGSTGEPKGVLLSHANIVANLRAIGRALALGPEDVVVSWLPLYHDMGLIGAWLGALYFGIPIVIMSPLAFLARPARWLRALHAHRATVSAAPNFAFELCARKITDDDLQGLELSAWRLALNGAEPVSPDTIERFTRRFAPYGFRPEAMCPVYGLAEASLGLTFPPIGRGPRVDRVDRDRFQRRGEAHPASPEDPNPLRFVSCGRPLPEHAVRIVDAEGWPAGERIGGRIEFRGPSVTAGYFRNREATRAVLHDGWMDSGDLGYWADDELFVTGRRKDVIIKAGRNLYPQEAEEAVGNVPGIRRGCVAAFGVADPERGTERLVVVAESRETIPERQERLKTEIVDRVVAAVGIPPDIVVICRPGAVPKTSSGKLRRRATCEAYLSGELGRRPSIGAQWARLLIHELGARLRHRATRAGALAYAGYVGALLALTVPALWALVLLLPRGRVLDRVVRGGCRAVLALARCPIRVEGLEHCAGPAVFVANHASYLDAVALLAAVPAEFRFVAKRELASIPLIGTVIRKLGYLTVERGDFSRTITDTQHVMTALREGASLFFFPEGTFVRAPGLLPFKLGAFKVAVETGRPVVPVAIRGTREILPDGSWVPRPGAIVVEIGAPIEPRDHGWSEMVRLRDLARAQIARRLSEEPSNPDNS